MEVIIAMTIIVLLSGVVGVSLSSLPQRGRVSQAKMQLSSFKTAIQLYIADNGVPPTQRQGLDALVVRPVVEPIPRNYKDGGYLDSTAVPEDPWGYQYIYLAPGTSGELFEVVTYGADGVEGGEKFAADISTSALQENSQE